MKLQLLLLGVVAVLTVGALTLADSVPTASISVPGTPASPSPAASQAPALVAVPASATTADTAATPVQVAVTEPSAAPDSESMPASSGCATVSQIFQSTHGKHMLTPAKSAQLIAVCAVEAPNTGQLVKQAPDTASGGSGHAAGGDAGD